MEQRQTKSREIVARTMFSERQQLVRFCARLTGNAIIAEDLAHEAFTEAWRCADALRDPDHCAAWIRGIARNLCRHYLRDIQRDRRMHLPITPGDDEFAVTIADPRSVTDELEAELARDELAELLDRALALLPDKTRDALIQRYLEESGYAEIAAQLGTSGQTAMVRIHRGKLMLRRILLAEAGHDEVANELIGMQDDGWRKTRIWCPHCGEHHLEGRFSMSPLHFELRCPGCPSGLAESCQTTGPLDPEVSHQQFNGVRGFKSLLNRRMKWVDQTQRVALTTGSIPCDGCGNARSVQLTMGDHVPPYLRQLPGIHMWCPTCRSHTSTALSHLVLYSPEGRTFWRDHPRIHERRIVEIERDGRPALDVSFESIRGDAQFDAICDQRTYQILSTHVIHRAE